MRVRTAPKLLLALALVLGQWLTIAHAQEHPALGAASHVCLLCLHGQGLDSGAVPTLPSLALSSAQEAPVHAAVRLVPVAVPTYYPIRAPPVPVC